MLLYSRQRQWCHNFKGKESFQKQKRTWCTVHNRWLETVILGIYQYLTANYPGVCPIDVKSSLLCLGQCTFRFQLQMFAAGSWHIASAWLGRTHYADNIISSPCLRRSVCIHFPRNNDENDLSSTNRNNACGHLGDLRQSCWHISLWHLTVCSGRKIWKWK